MTDWGAPSGSALARIPDLRARQFWDPQHLVTQDVSRAAARRQPALPGPSCCIHGGLHWDEAILYPSGSHWQQAPAPAVWDGPVAEIMPRLEAALGADRADRRPLGSEAKWALERNSNQDGQWRPLPPRRGGKGVGGMRGVIR
jgi:hypothetical protein